MSNKKHKLLFIGPTPPPYSGPELSMQQFLESKSLNESFDISFLKTNFRSNNKNKGKFGIGMILNFFKYFIKLVLLLIKKRPKLVYYPITPTQIGWLGRDVWTILISKLFKAKVVIHLRGSHFKLNFSQFHPITKKIIGFSLKQVNTAIVQANYLNDQFYPFIQKKQVKTLYQAMDINEFSNSSIEDVEAGKILVVGHMTKAKGFTDILKVIPEIVKQHPYVKFYFAGDMRRGERGVFFNQVTGDKIVYEDPYEAEEILLSKGFQNNYKNLGIIEGEEKLNHFMSSQLFLTASYSEGFSRSLLEAMAVGKPLIFTPVGAHKEVLEDGKHGYSFIPGDLEGMRTALLNLLSNNKALIEIGKTNRSYVETSFSIKHIINQFKAILDNTIKA
ncbi:glycosyltransferase family 4 protein [Ichthyenterobacterium sp. W332]|uniref:Glycosyltransferase family 4 protein n=1 Tax=Microcosmobacter mediterraneus TaxID=3075607 RepID=A0ABU2YML1_9FLAO|nr:glycosyltransferase family 4 protein [Ichthyenterobacterium sp. W332]MDT0559381.1 glycosyltransferase family 4 protein [Ichthyenterobacterium sp. W332]